MRNVLLKALGLFLAVNMVFALVNPLPALGKLSAYNRLFAGRPRLPYGDRPDLAYNLSLYNLEALFASHEIAGKEKPADEYRVVLIGDSSTWGFLLRPEDTLSALLNARGLATASGKPVRFYNLGYPTLSLTKDLLMLSRAVAYQPDLIVWLVTLESFPVEKQLASPIVQNNPQAVRELILDGNLRLDPDSEELITPTRWEQTLIGQRRALADWFRLQLYGVLWSATGVDQVYPEKYDPPQRDLTDEEAFYGLEPPAIDQQALAFEVLEAGAGLVGDIPILFVNEPIYLSDGQNSDIRYNFYYPRWIYDQYRQEMDVLARSNGWLYLDAWDLVPPEEFTNSAIHFTPAGENLLAEQIGEKLSPTLNER